MPAANPSTAPIAAPAGAATLVRRSIAPTRVLWTQGAVVRPERLLKPGSQAVVHDPACCVLPPGAAVLLDFGHELNGALQIITAIFDPKRPARVRVRFGESASEAMGEPDADHANHDQVVQVPWCGSVEVGPTGFRFARIDVVDDAVSLPLVGVRAITIARDLRRVGSFACSDPRIDAVFEVGARTVEWCMQELLWDGIKRDRLAWMGDLHPEAMVVAALHGDHAVVRDTLDFLRDTTPLPQWMNTLGSYSLWWIITHRDWYQRHGDLGYLRQQRAYLAALTEQVASRVDEAGALKIEGVLIDWAAARDAATTVSGGHSLAVIALEAAVTLLAALGERSDAAVAALARLRRHGLPPAATKQAAALAVLAGLRTPAEAEGAVLGRDPAKGLSPFYGYYVLEARSRAVGSGPGLDLLRRYWGGMIDLGATTFWEQFDLDWLPAGRIDELPKAGERDIHRECGDHCYVGLRNSFCHGWSGGPTAWLMDHVLGVTPSAPGFARVRIAPDLGDLSWARGVVPTPKGPITVEHRKRPDGSVESRIELPPE